MEEVFQKYFSASDSDLSPALSKFKSAFYTLPNARTQKHLPDRLKIHRPKE
jgi:hypothetical protein